MVIEILSLFYSTLPVLCIVTALFCWIVGLLVQYRIARIASSCVIRLLELSGESPYRSRILLSFFASTSGLRFAASRAILQFSIAIQATLTLLAACCWSVFGRAFFSSPSTVPSDLLAIPSEAGSVFGNLLGYIPLMDDVSFAFVSLTVLIFLLSFGLLSKEVHRNLPFWCGLLFLLEGFLVVAFTTPNLLIFYISFEATLFPMYLLIGAWGSRARKVRANLYFFLYTLVGSFATLVGLIILYHSFGTLSYSALVASLTHGGSGVEAFYAGAGSFVWLLLSIGFLVKLPIFVCHLWLPEAHVEAPTVGSVILAALLLKLGVYGFFRVSIILLSDGAAVWAPYLLPIALLGTFYPAAVAVVQDDVKKIIAYSSVSHMSLALTGLLTLTPEGAGGALFLAMGHGITSGGLFAFVGLLYDRYRSRDLKYLGGIASTMPYGSATLLILILGNVGFPFLCNFPGELFILVGSFKRFGFVLSAAVGLGFFLTAVYNFRLLNLVAFGSSKIGSVGNYYDLTRDESAVLYSFGWVTALLGIFCSPILSSFIEIASITFM